MNQNLIPLVSGGLAAGKAGRCLTDRWPTERPS